TWRFASEVGDRLAVGNDLLRQDYKRRWRVLKNIRDVHVRMWQVHSWEGHCEKILQSVLQAAPDSVKNIARQLFSEGCERLEKQSSERPLGDGVPAKELLTNWMRRARWQETFGRARHDIPVLVTFSEMPWTSGRPFC
ncbi:hypothetical protein EDB81DRAFT_671791, partial [Dactylonectria macrodidyma]